MYSRSMGGAHSTRGARAGERLKSYAVEAQQAELVPLVKLDFRHQQRGEVVQVHVWHDTDDDCGVLCHDVHTFFADLAATVNTFTNSTPIKVVPRFIYETCTGTAASSERCKRGCVNNGKCALCAVAFVLCGVRAV